MHNSQGNKILIEKTELDGIQNTLAQALEALLHSLPVANDKKHEKGHQNAIGSIYLTMTNLRKLT